MTIKTALLSYGLSGRVFHAPFIDFHKGFELAGAWERSKQLIQQTYPGVRSYNSIEEILADASIDLVIVNTPIDTHFNYAKQALEAGKHIIVEKAFTTTSAEAIKLKAIAEKQGCKIAVFHNRRWDSDFKTVQKIITEGSLGEINEAEIHFERFKTALSAKQHKETPTAGNGILKDLGPHIIDQALCLFGTPDKVFADIRITRHGSLIDDWFDIMLYYSAMRVRLKGGYIVREPLPAYIFHGTKGSFIKSRADVQENDLAAGMKPNLTGWGTEPDIAKGLLHAEKEGKITREPVPALQGNYYDFYQGVYTAISKDQPMPVTANDGINVMKIIEASVKSSKLNEVITFS